MIITYWIARASQNLLISWKITKMCCFFKLKKGGFVIDTPYGNYSPDWAVVCRKEALANMNEEAKNH